MKKIFNDAELTKVRSIMSGWLEDTVNLAADTIDDPDPGDDMRKDLLFGKAPDNTTKKNNDIPGGAALEDFEMSYDDYTLTLHFDDASAEDIKSLRDEIVKSKYLQCVDNGYYGSVSDKGLLDTNWSDVDEYLERIANALNINEKLEGGEYSYKILSVDIVNDEIKVKVDLSFLEIWLPENI